jgi:hypothetical protein
VGSKTLTDCAWDLHLPKRLQPDTHRLQIHWPGIHITSRKTSKKRSRATEQFTAPPINWRWVQKHSHTVHGTSIYQKDFSLTPIDYKSTDLEYTSQQKDLKKSGQGPQNSSQHHQWIGGGFKSTHRLCMGPPFTKKTSAWHP